MEFNGVLLLYRLPLAQDAPTILENVRAYEENSQFKVCKVNTYLGFPASLAQIKFSAIAFHYSLFGNWPFALDENYLNYIEHSSSSYKIAFFQDEYQYCRQRFDFINRFKIDCVYTLLEPETFPQVYQSHARVPAIVHHLTGYVSDELVALAGRLTLPDEKRSIDVGYRARPLPFYMGKGAQEKTEIAIEFRRRAAGRGLRLDIETDEDKRIYGQAWYEFVATCRSMLGVEAGVSIFDIDGVVRARVDKLMSDEPGLSFEAVTAKLLQRWEDNIYYRTISPRHFEAAAFRVCQILFEGNYSGVMKPMVHYIPLKKDFSNLEECLGLLQDQNTRAELTRNAYRDLIASGHYSYAKFIAGFDDVLSLAGLRPAQSSLHSEDLLNRLNRETRLLELRQRKNDFLYNDFPGRRPLAAVGGPLLRALRRLRGRAA